MQISPAADECRLAVFAPWQALAIYGLPGSVLPVVQLQAIQQPQACLLPGRQVAKLMQISPARSFCTSAGSVRKVKVKRFRVGKTGDAKMSNARRGNNQVQPPFQCIYSNVQGGCRNQSPASREHYLPRGLGRFEGDVYLLNRVCRECNERLNPVDDVFLHNSPEAFFRYIVGRFARRSHRDKPVFYERTFGVPPMAVLGQQPGTDFEVLIEPVPNTIPPEGRQLRQVILRDSRGYHQLYIPPSMQRADQFERALVERGLRGARLISAFFDDAEREWLERLLARYLRRANTQLRHADLIHSRATIPIRIEVNISPMYYQAIAKIAFHTLLKLWPQFTGLESEFTDIKNFIVNGGDYRQFMRQTSDFLLPELADGATPSNWFHFLALSARRVQVQSAHGILTRLWFFFVRMKFFVGPLHTPKTWEVHILDPRDFPFETSGGRAFIYYSGALIEDAFHGAIEEATGAERVIPVRLFRRHRRLR